MTNLLDDFPLGWKKIAKPFAKLKILQTLIIGLSSVWSNFQDFWFAWRTATIATRGAAWWSTTEPPGAPGQSAAEPPEAPTQSAA